jgi:hypothetical protein
MEMSGKIQARRQQRPLSPRSLCLGPPPHALDVTVDLDKEKRLVGRSDNDLGAGSTGCDGGIDERLREEGFLPAFPLLSSARPKSRGS